MRPNVHWTFTSFSFHFWHESINMNSVAQNMLQFTCDVQKQSNESLTDTRAFPFCLKYAHELQGQNTLSAVWIVKPWVCASPALRIKFLLRLSRLIPAPVLKGTNSKNIYSGASVGKDWMKDFFNSFFTLDCWEIKLTVVNEIFQIFPFFSLSLSFGCVCGISSGVSGLKVANEFQRNIPVRFISIQQSDV